MASPNKKARIAPRSLFAEPRTVEIVGAPLSEGQSLQGVDLGPDSMRKAGVRQIIENLNWVCEDPGDLALKAAMQADHVTAPADMAEYRRWKASGPAHLKKRFSVWFKDEDLSAQPPAAEPADEARHDEEVVVYRNVKNSEAIGHACRMIYESTKRAAEAGRFVLTIGGDHSIAAGTITGVAEARPGLGVIWIDAHGDCNTPETTPSGNYHGMPAAHVMGWIKQGSIPGFDWLAPTIPENKLCFIGLRDLDPLEKKMLRESDVTVFTMHEVDKYGISRVVDMAIKAVCPTGDTPIHLSFDVDAIDPQYAPGTGTKCKGGLTYREAHYICETVAATGMLGSMDLVEINPTLDAEEAEHMHGDNPLIHGTPTVVLGVELVASALGKTIM